MQLFLAVVSGVALSLFGTVLSAHVQRNPAHVPFDEWFDRIAWSGAIWFVLIWTTIAFGFALVLRDRLVLEVTGWGAFAPAVLFSVALPHTIRAVKNAAVRWRSTREFGGAFALAQYADELTTICFVERISEAGAAVDDVDDIVAAAAGRTNFVCRYVLGK